MPLRCHWRQVLLSVNPMLITSAVTLSRGMMSGGEGSTRDATARCIDAAAVAFTESQFRMQTKPLQFGLKKCVRLRCA